METRRPSGFKISCPAESGWPALGGPFQSLNGPLERAGVMNFVGRERANLAGGKLGQRDRCSIEAGMAA